MGNVERNTDDCTNPTPEYVHYHAVGVSSHRDDKIRDTVRNAARRRGRRRTGDGREGGVGAEVVFCNHFSVPHNGVADLWNVIPDRD